MQRRTFLATAFAAVLAMAEADAHHAVAQTAAGEHVGTWSLVKVQAGPADKRTEQFGTAPKGQLILTADGRYSLILARADLPKVAANARAKGTADENKAIVVGSVASFGSYKVEGSEIAFVVEGSTFANWIGETQKRSLKVTGEELTYSNADPARPALSTDLTWSRVK